MLAVSDYFSIPPLGTFFFEHVSDDFGLAVFALEGTLISALAAAMHASRGRAEEGQRALQHSEERFRSLVQNSSDIVVLLDRDGAVLYESPAIERVLGFRPEERIGANALELLHPEDAGPVGRVFAEILQKPGVHASAEYRVRDKQGRWRHFEAVVVNSRGSGIRDAVYDLRQENGSRRSFSQSVEALVDLNRRIGEAREVTLAMEGEPLPELPERHAAELLRVVQEALTNARRHSQARHGEFGPSGSDECPADRE